jgi:hypothetical protein
MNFMASPPLTVGHGLEAGLLKPKFGADHGSGAGAGPEKP